MVDALVTEGVLFVVADDEELCFVRLVADVELALLKNGKENVKHSRKI